MSSTPSCCSKCNYKIQLRKQPAPEHNPRNNSLSSLRTLSLSNSSTPTFCSVCFPKRSISDEQTLSFPSFSSFSTFSFESPELVTDGPWTHLLKHFERNGSVEASRYIIHPLDCPKCIKMLKDLKLTGCPCES